MVPEASYWNTEVFMTDGLLLFLKWVSSAIILLTGTSALFTDAYTKDAAGKRRITLLGWFQIAGLVAGFSIFIVSAGIDASKKDTEKREKAQLTADLTAAKQSSAEAVTRLE